MVSGLAFGGSPSETGTPKAVTPASGESSSGLNTPSGNTSSTFSGPMTADKAAAIGANELGQIPVLRYQDISTERGTDIRSPADLAKDIDLLKSEGFQPINLRDLASGNIDIPAGMSPVVLTFDDSTIGQYNLLDDGTLDPESAVGILQAAVDSGKWAPKATFYCLLDVTSKDNELFGQPDNQQEKLRNLVDWGYEVGSHTVSNLNLSKAPPLDVVKELLDSQQTLQELIGGDYRVTSLSVPAGEYPQNEALLASGSYEGKTYTYTSAVTLGDTLCVLALLHALRRRCTSRASRSPGTRCATPWPASNRTPDSGTSPTGTPPPCRRPRTLAAGLGEVRDDLGRPIIRY